ncbi:hypothetical protein AAC387_Pa06g1678 [Persea americana]
MKKLLSGSPSVSLLSICFWCVVNLLRLVELSQAQDATNRTTDPSEVSALNSMFQKWGVSAAPSTWNTTGDPCSGSAIDDNVLFSSDSMNPGLKCLCDFNNGTTCHITRMRVKALLDVGGPIPEELGNLTKLFDLDLAQNYLTGPLPAFIGNLTDMQYLHLPANALSGPIPKEIGKLQKLILLSIASNNFNGSLPPELGNLVNLEQLYMDSSGVGGEIPSTFSNLVNLKTVWASDCPFNGTIPNFIGSWNQLTELRLEGNCFDGPIPSSFLNFTKLTDLRISDLSNVSTSLGFIRDMKSLKILKLRNNMISDTIPSNIGEYTSLEELDLSFNNITGEIPPALFNLVSLLYLFLGNNSLSGTLPANKQLSLSNIDLSYNQLSGSFPSWVAQEDLQLNLVANNFIISSTNSNNLPSGLECLQRDFSCNQGSPIYSKFAVNCGGLQLTSGGTVFEKDNAAIGAASYYVSDAKGWAVSNVGSFTDNRSISYTTDFSSQTNTISSKLYQTSRVSPGSLRYYGLRLENGLYNISLRFAETAFDDSRTWERVGKRVFDIYIQGILVSKDFDIRKEADGFSFRGVQKEFQAPVSKNFLEIHLFWAGKGTCCIPFRGTYGPTISAISAIAASTPNVSNGPRTTTSSRTGLIVVIVVGVAVSFVLLFSILIFRRKRLGMNKDEDLPEMGPNTFSYAELRTATEDFNPSNKLGQGGFGVVYKGTLSDGRVVAVKQLLVTSHQGESQFVTEMATISAVQHRNLVQLYGCCIEEDKRLLVYEYLENNSLEQALFGTRSLLFSSV